MSNISHRGLFNNNNPNSPTQGTTVAYTNLKATTETKFGFIGFKNKDPVTDEMFWLPVGMFF